MSSSSLFHAWSSSKKVVVDIKESPSKTVVSKSISNWNLETRDELDPIRYTNLGSNNTKRVFFRAKKLKKRAAKKKRRTKRRVPRTCASSTNLTLPCPTEIAIVVQSSVFVGEIGRKMRTKMEEEPHPIFVFRVLKDEGLFKRGFKRRRKGLQRYAVW